MNSMAATAVNSIEEKLNKLSAELDLALSQAKNEPVHDNSTPIVFRYEDIEDLYIRTETRKLQKIKLRNAQKKIIDEINDMSLSGQPVRILLEKCRRLGSTTLFAAIDYILMRDYGYKVVIIGHDSKSSTAVFKMIKLFYEKDRRVAAETPSNTKRELVLGAGGEVWVASAKTDEIERGSTNQVIHAPEFALWPRDPDALMTAAALTVSDVPNTFIFIESTPKGVGNSFHNRCIEAERGADEYGNKSPYRFIFIGWQDNEEYVKPFASEEDRQRFIDSLGQNDPEEIALADSGCTLEQLNWRRHKIIAGAGYDFKSKLQNFHQEYPSNWQEGFLTSSRTKFNVNILRKWLEATKVEPVLFKGEFNYSIVSNWSAASSGGWYAQQIINEAFSENIAGRMSIWSWPQQYVDYCAGVDVSEGLEYSPNRVDDTSITILEQVSGVQVAHWRGKIAPEDLSDMLCALMEFYNEAFVCVEANRDGRYVLKGMVGNGYNEGRIYKRRGGSNIAHEEEVDRLGFYTSWNGQSGTKPILLAQLAEHISREKILIKDPGTINELARAKVMGDGKIVTNGMDDLMSCALAVEAKVNAFAHVSHDRPKPKSRWESIMEGLGRDEARSALWSSQYGVRSGGPGEIKFFNNWG